MCVIISEVSGKYWQQYRVMQIKQLYTLKYWSKLCWKIMLIILSDLFPFLIIRQVILLENINKYWGKRLFWLLVQRFAFLNSLKKESKFRRPVKVSSRNFTLTLGLHVAVVSRKLCQRAKKADLLYLSRSAL